MERVVLTERRSRKAKVIKKSNRRSEIEAKGGRKGGEGRTEEVEVQAEVWRKKRKDSSQGTSSGIMETVDSECLEARYAWFTLSLQR
jgi:hypothetical protein